MFGAPGSAACAAAAKADGTKPVPGVHCLLSGPDDNRADLLSGLPAGVSASEGEELVVPPGPWCSRPPMPAPRTRRRSTSPTAQFYVLKDNVVAVRQRDHQPAAEHRSVAAPRTSSSASPARAGPPFQDVTRTIARRGESDQRRLAAAQPALRGRARQQADHRPADRLQQYPGRDPRRSGRGHHRRLHDPVGSGSRHRTPPRRPADQPEADLRVDGVGHAGAAGAAPGTDRGPGRPADRRDLPARLLPHPRRDRDRRPGRLRASTSTR